MEKRWKENGNEIEDIRVRSSEWTERITTESSVCICQVLQQTQRMLKRSEVKWMLPSYSAVMIENVAGGPGNFEFFQHCQFYAMLACSYSLLLFKAGIFDIDILYLYILFFLLIHVIILIKILFNCTKSAIAEDSPIFGRH